MKKCVVFTGGGTGGHVYPALAVVDYLKNENISICWMGSSKGMEKRIIDRTEIPFYNIPSGKLRRYFSFRNFTDLFRIAAALIRSLYLLRKLRPVMVFSKGGFVSVPPVIAAFLLKIPVYTHDSDICPGLATRINSRFADRILLSSEESRKYFSPSRQEKIRITGNPVREAMRKGSREEGRKIAGLKGDLSVILIMGGSSGAEQINNLVYDVLDRLTERYFVIHQSGEKNYRELEIENYLGVPYFNEELSHILAAADLVISRSGASALWEFSAAGLPSLLIPLESGSRGEQVINAEAFRDAGCSEILRGDISPETFLDSIENIMDNEKKLSEMKQAALQLGKTDGADLISRMIKGVL